MVPMGNHPKDENKYRRGRELIVVIKTKVPPLPCDRHLTHDRWPDQAPHGHDCREDEQRAQAELRAEVHLSIFQAVRALPELLLAQSLLGLRAKIANSLEPTLRNAHSVSAKQGVLPKIPRFL